MDLDRILEPLFVEPACYFARRGVRCGEIALWRAVIENAIKLARGNHIPKGSTENLDVARLEARRWILAVDETPGGFDWICHLLWWEAEYVRGRLRAEGVFDLDQVTAGVAA